MLFRVLDIETVPDRDVWAPSGDPKWVVRPHPSCAWAAGGYFTQGEMCYVQDDPFPPPQAHRVVAVAWCDVDMLPVRDKTYKLAGGQWLGDWSLPDSERAMLERFVAEQEKQPATIVSWNGRTFDLPVLAMRALHLGVPWRWYYAERDVRYRYSADGHCDLMDFLSDYGASRQMKLGDAARLIGLPGKTDMDGSKVADVVAEGVVAENMLKVGRYCLQDVIQTAILFVRTRYHLGIITREGYEESLRSFEESPLVGESGIVIEWDRLKIGGQP